MRGQNVKSVNFRVFRVFQRFLVFFVFSEISCVPVPCSLRPNVSLTAQTCH